ncbi:glycerol-3-phosphate phosphatase [Blastomyces gilchristii SLH14081]|uniref:Glycerol-3-phosphate phosphatase n=1 Tax=Blastomyces gilchristii (strain SLH14081) TaxID=559298 RepID=A0A179UHR2_BLAGS|nr:glycerol-3-phosphate phosphatase [Blastomyces gilchristii SLH14081]OAT07293.1 glycerol-3-phosphate phosphatase [Blastomyces gilchristii SLH14081]
MPGAKAPLNQAEAQLAPWAIVTSGTTGLVTGWLKVLGLPKPKHMVLAEDALMGRQSLGLEAKDTKTCFVFEDTPAGITAGKAAD